MAGRLLLRRAVPASVSSPGVLCPKFDREVEVDWSTKPMCKKKCKDLEPKTRPVLPLEMRYDSENEEIVVCNFPRGYLVKYAAGATRLLYSDLNKYWAGEVLQEIYSDILDGRKGGDVAAGAAAAATGNPDCSEFGKDLDVTLRTLEKFGSVLAYELGTCCTRDENGVLSVVVDDCFQDAVTGCPIEFTQPTGYTLWTVTKDVVKYSAYEVARACSDNLQTEWVVIDKDKVRVAMNASEEEVNKASQVKVAVEIDRSVLELGKLVIFMAPASAWNPYEVCIELYKAGFDMSGLELELELELEQYKYTLSRLKHALRYRLLIQDREPFRSESEDEL